MLIQPSHGTRKVRSSTHGIVSSYTWIFARDMLPNRHAYSVCSCDVTCVYVPSVMRPS